MKIMSMQLSSPNTTVNNPSYLSYYRISGAYRDQMLSASEMHCFAVQACICPETDMIYRFQAFVTLFWASLILHLFYCHACCIFFEKKPAGWLFFPSVKLSPACSWKACGCPRKASCCDSMVSCAIPLTFFP